MARLTTDEVEDFYELPQIDQEFLAEGHYTACLSCWINFFAYQHQYLHRACLPIPKEVSEFKLSCRKFTCLHQPLAINHVIALLEMNLKDFENLKI
jgi:hypothetical protein